PDDLTEGLDGLLALARLHLLETRREQPIDGRIARAAPHLPHRALRQVAHERIAVAQRGGQLRQIVHEPGLAEGPRALTAAVHAAGVGERLQRLFASGAGAEPRAPDA